MAKQKSRFPSYGLVRGPSHAQGGVAGVVAGKQPVELEGGEWVVPKEVVPDYLPQLVQMTNEGRAMQGMDNGNSAMDALIASASMQNGITEPQSPMYKRGGHMCKKCNKYQEGGLAQECVGGECVVPTIDNQSGLFSMPWKGQDIQIDLMSGMGDREASQYLASDKAGEYFMMPSSDIPADSLKAWYSQMEGLPMPSIPQQQGGPIYDYQAGGQVKPNVMDYLNQLQSSYEKYQGDVLTESGAPMFGPEGGRTKAGYAEKYNFPLEEAKFDTLYDTGSLKGYNVTLPGNRVFNLIKQQYGGTDKSAEMARKAGDIKTQMRKDYESEYMDLGSMLEGGAGEAIKAVEAGYLDMGPFEKMDYDLDKSGIREKRAKKEAAQSSAEKQMMMKALGMSEKEYDDFQAMKARLGKRNYQGGGGVPEDFLAHLESKEGFKSNVYLDSLDNPTAGIGHLLTEAEKKQYKVGQEVPEKVLNEWVKNDSEKAYNAALAQAEELGIDKQNQKMINALGSVNFQLGTGWRKEGKFPGVWEAMKDKNYELAAKNVQWKVPTDTIQGVSDWYEQTPTRAKDFMEALRGYKKRGGGPIYGYQQGGPVDYSRTAGLYNRFLAQGDSPDMMRTQDILKWRALQDAESSSPEMYDAQSEVGRQFGKDALLTQALLSSVGMEGASAKDKYDLVKALSPAGKQVYYSQYFDDKRAGGPIDYYQTGGQALPRAQKEVRRSIDPGFSVSPRYGQNPITGGPMRPVEMPTLPSVNLDPGFYMKDDQTGMDSLLKQLMMRGVNQSTGDSTASTVLGSMKMQQGGMVGGPQLMQDMGQDRRIKPLQPDRYVMKDDTPGGEGHREMSVPKLNSAYLGVLGMETPLSKRQGALLSERGIPPQSMAPHLESLVGRVLIQRLGNEPQ